MTPLNQIIDRVLGVTGCIWPEADWAREAAAAHRTLERSLPRDGEPDLSTSEGRRSLTRAVWSASDILSGARIRSSPGVAAAVKIALVLHDEDARDMELASTRSLGPGGPPCSSGAPANDGETRRVECPTRIGVDAGPVEFAFPWRPSAVGTRQRLGTATGHVHLTTVDPGDAPVVFSLRTPEGRLEVRRHGTAWLRPLLSPDSWVPIGEPLFRKVVAAGVAWRDSPFLPHTGRCRPTFHLRDYAYPRRMANGDGRRIDEARDACLARAGWLCVIDGVVHRTTEEPMAGMATLVVDGQAQVRPAWSLGSLDSTCVMDTSDCHEGENGRWIGGEAYSDASSRPPCRRGFVTLSDWSEMVRTIPRTFRWNEMTGASSWLSPTDLVHVVQPQAERTDGRDILRAAVMLSAGAMSEAARRAVAIGRPCEFGQLERLLLALNTADGGTVLRQDMLDRVEALCQRVSAALATPMRPVDRLWAYVVALATYAAQVEAAPMPDDDLIELRL